MRLRYRVYGVDPLWYQTTPANCELHGQMLFSRRIAAFKRLKARAP